MNEEIIVRGAREHNLKNIDVRVPKNKLVVCTGVSGSGKSSFAMDTLYAEGQRRYVESLSAYARQFLGRMEKPDVDSIEGLSPAIAIDQKTVSHNPRSTVGTVTEIYDYLRLLYARIGHPHCPECGREIQHLTVDQITQSIMKLAQSFEGYSPSRGARIMLLAPVIRERKGEFSQLFANLRRDGYSRIRLDGRIHNLAEDIVLIKTNRHTIEVVVDRLNLQFKKGILDDSARTRLTQSVETCLKLANGLVIVGIVKDAALEFPENPQETEEHLFSEQFACPECNVALPELEPRLFSFNAPQGACPQCSGLGVMPKVEAEALHNPRLSILEGGIFPWSNVAEQDSWRLSILRAVSEAHGIDLGKPLGQMSKEELKIIFYGTGKQSYHVKYKGQHGFERSYQTTYEGIIPNLERRYQETDSDYIRSEIEKYMVKEPCSLCKGARLKEEVLGVTIDERSIIETSRLSISHLYTWVEGFFRSSNPLLNSREQKISTPIIKEILLRLDFLRSVGLDYLTLDRTAATLAGGESQRIRLASQIGSGLSGVLYVLDEPSIGLHDRDQGRLINTLLKLRDLGNTVVVVEHDPQTMLAADQLIDFGRGAGKHGGEIIAQGTPAEIIKDADSVTGPYLAGTKQVKIDEDFLRGQLLSQDFFDPDSDTNAEKPNSLKLIGCRGHNLKNIEVEIPLGKLVCVTGVSGSGKSTLVNETLLRALRQEFNLKNDEKPAPHDGMLGAENVARVIAIDQSPIGRTPRSNPATYTKAFDGIRELFASTNEAKIRGYSVGRFSFNTRGGRCEACEGEGQIRIEMQFLPDIYVDCEVCQGARYNRDTLDILYKGKNIAEVLKMTVEEALGFFNHIPKVDKKLQILADVGLGYLELGQIAPTLSGGEAQRIKLAAELGKRAGAQTFYILDEPTTGLHFVDLNKLLSVLKLLVLKGNTVVVVEHNLDIIRNADWVIDLGPEGGEAGGEVIFAGTVNDLLRCEKSHTAESLRRELKDLKLK